MKRVFYSLIIAALISTLALGAEVRKLTQEDIEWGDPATTVTSAAGHVGHRIDNTYRVSPGWINVKAAPYSAAGDNVTDDTAAIRAALAAAYSGYTDGTNKSVFMPPGIYLISGQLVVPYGVRLIGSGRSSTYLWVTASFAEITTTGVIRLGDGTVPVFGTSVESLGINCNNIAGSIGIYSSDVQDNSGVKDVLINNWVAYGIKFDGGAGPLSVNDFYIVNTEVLRSNTGGAGGVGVYIKDGTFGGDIRNVAVFGRAANPPTAGYQFNNYPGILYKVACDGDGNHAGIDCVKIDSNAGGVSIYGLISNYWDNAIHTSSLYQVVAINIYRTAAGGTKTIVDDGVSGSTAITITDYFVPLFVRGSTKAQFNGIKSFGDIVLSSPSYGVILTAADGTQKRIGLNATYDNIIFTDP